MLQFQDIGISDALAYLDCTGNSRMECGDRWLIYATINDGELLDNDGVTAVHHRKTVSHS